MFLILASNTAYIFVEITDEKSSQTKKSYTHTETVANQTFLVFDVFIVIILMVYMYINNVMIHQCHRELRDSWLRWRRNGAQWAGQGQGHSFMVEAEEEIPHNSEPQPQQDGSSNIGGLHVMSAGNVNDDRSESDADAKPIQYFGGSNISVNWISFGLECLLLGLIVLLDTFISIKRNRSVKWLQ